MIGVPKLECLYGTSSALGDKASFGVDAAFLTDLEVHVRFLLAVPLLLLAEGAVRRRLAPLLQQFLVLRLLPEDAIPGFEAVVAAASRLRDSKRAQAVLLAIVYGVGIGVVWSKWLRGAMPADGDLLGSPDVSSQADLGTSCEVVRGMNITPLSSHVVLPLTMATLAPILPLVLTLIPLNELLKKLLGIGL
jgi:hypothetical protein